MKNLQRLLRGSCVYFTVIALFLTVLDFLSDASGVLASERFLLIFPAALTISAAGMILHNKTFPRWGRILCHYMLTTLGIFVFLYLPTKETVQPMMALAMYLVFSVVYWILFFFIHIIGGRIRRLMELD
jgi:hypothetical protein